MIDSNHRVQPQREHADNLTSLLVMSLSNKGIMVGHASNFTNKLVVCPNESCSTDNMFCYILRFQKDASPDNTLWHDSNTQTTTSRLLTFQDQSVRQHSHPTLSSSSFREDAFSVDTLRHETALKISCKSCNIPKQVRGHDSNHSANLFKLSQQC